MEESLELVDEVAAAPEESVAVLELALDVETRVLLPFSSSSATTVPGL